MSIKKKSQAIIEEAGNLPHKFPNKIKTVQEIQKLIKKRPRKKTVVMCHGTFDIVHPGHVRQLIYAKSKGDILVVSLTIDKHVSKGYLRPYVPQELRAINLAAFEIVDYVLIDYNPTPIENILFLQPDFFVKGFEYSKGGIHPRTKEEIDALSTYGGEIIFSPGDIVYSSTKLLSIHKPRLSIEQLLTLMNEEKVSFEDLRQTISKFKNLKIHVIGDIILDKYSRCSVIGPTSKSPAFSVRVEDTSSYTGGSGIVAKHLSALGADVTLTTVLSDDEAANFLIKDLKKSRVRVNAYIDSTRPSTIKERYYADTQLLLQVDKIDNNTITEEMLKKICSVIKRTKCDALVCSDFRHGIFNKENIARIKLAIPDGCLKVADSQVSNRWGNILDFADFDLITPNEKEARFALADQDTTIRPLAQKLYNEARCRFAILKLGRDGIMTYRSPGMESREYFYLDSFIDEAIDPIGAGDALLSAATSSLAASSNIVQASILGNIAAAIECSKLGNIPISAKELIDYTHEIEKGHPI